MFFSDGFIAPINPTEPQPSHAYFYNNIFFSHAIETKESFKLCQGDEANRKAAGQDHKNQKIIQYLRKDYKHTEIVKITGASPNTILKVKRCLNQTL